MLLIVATLLACCNGVDDAGYPADVTKWVVVTKPEEFSAGETRARSDLKNRWVLSVRDDGVLVRRVPSSRKAPRPPKSIEESVRSLFDLSCPRGGESCWLEVDDGWLVGCDGGEWGGGLWWVSRDQKSSYKLRTPSKRILLMVGKTPVAVGGAMNVGQADKLAKDRDGRWIATKIADIGGRPSAYCRDEDGNVLVATGSNLIRIHLNGRSEEVVTAAFNGYSPNSLAVDATGDIYVGMNHYIARVFRVGGHHEFALMVPAKEFEEASPASDNK